MKNRKFTLLEVIVAMVLLAIFVSGLLWQFSMAVNRSAENYRRWEYMHELSQATEQLLLVGPEGELDQSFLNPDYRIEYSYLQSEAVNPTPVSFMKLRLQTLNVKLYDFDQNILEELNIDVWGADVK